MNHYTTCYFCKSQVGLSDDNVWTDYKIFFDKNKHPLVYCITCFIQQFDLTGLFDNWHCKICYNIFTSNFQHCGAIYPNINLQNNNNDFVWCDICIPCLTFIVKEQNHILKCSCNICQRINNSFIQLK